MSPPGTSLRIAAVHQSLGFTVGFEALRTSANTSPPTLSGVNEPQRILPRDQFRSELAEGLTPPHDCCHAPLLRRCGELRQFFDVACIVLDDDLRLQIRRDLLDALDRRHSLR